jgi:phenylalanyl-tRNA synthetase beta chain
MLYTNAEPVQLKNAFPVKISYSWLREYIDIDLPAKELSDILTNIGLEVEAVESVEAVKGSLEGVVIGEVLSTRKHPNADKLTLAEVNLGNDKKVMIVCGAPNVQTGQKVPVATVGTTLHRGSESLTIKRSKIRGEISEGMICAEDELGLGDSHEGIMVLDANAVPGTRASDYFQVESDVVFEIGLTPNRIDGASHYGVARDLAAHLNQYEPKQASLPDTGHFQIDNEDLVIPVQIENPEACPRYTGLTISGITVGPSPESLQKRLRSVGLTPINNIVDITNFVLMETGQPLHAFDASKIDGRKIVVKTLREGTSFVTLDEVKRTLSENDLMICNASSGMCIGGVFGGIDSGVTDDTRAIFLESAYFNPAYIRRTAKKHGLNTDASFRFERGADPNMTLYALKRAALLIKEIAGGSISSPIQDVYPDPLREVHVTLVYQHLFRLVGKTIPVKAIKSILSSLDFEIIEEKKDGLVLQVPLYRVDVTREADVIEEILRIYGYHQVEVKARTTISVNPFIKPDYRTVANRISDLLVARGFHEIMANSLTRSAYYENSEDFRKEDTVILQNPLSQDLNAMRQTLLFGGLEAIIYNMNRQRNDLKFFEFGTLYALKTPGKTNDPLSRYREETMLGLFMTGHEYMESWHAESVATDFFGLKGIVQLILTQAGISSHDLEVSFDMPTYYKEGIRYEWNGRELVRLGTLSKDALVPFEIEQEVHFAEFHFEALMNAHEKIRIQLESIPKFPEVRRDLALLIDRDVRFEDIRKLAFQTENQRLKKVVLFDVYTGEELGRNKKSYAVSFTLQDPDKTLADKEIEKIMHRLMQAYQAKLGAQIR